MKIVDLKEMPNFNPVVKNGVDSVSTEKVYLACYQAAMYWQDDGTTDPLEYQGKLEEVYPNVSPDEIKEWKELGLITFYPHCIKHGAMNKVTPEGIWRCLMCGEGCWEVSECQ